MICPKSNGQVHHGAVFRKSIQGVNSYWKKWRLEGKESVKADEALDVNRHSAQLKTLEMFLRLCIEALEKTEQNDNQFHKILFKLCKYHKPFSISFRLVVFYPEIQTMKKSDALCIINVDELLSLIHQLSYQ
ncbi:UNVERIFIED_CONTAM: hypothetical protein NCL1_49526 [Trichonephila clavipes]